MSDEIHYPTEFCLKDIVSWGNTGMVCLDESSQTIVKSPHGEENEGAITIERRIYERASEHGGHSGLLHYYGPYELEISKYRATASLGQQIANALCFIHSQKVIHGDLTCGNVLLDKHLNAKVVDFAGSSLDGCALLVAVTASYRYPGPALSIQGDIFALGSTFFEIMTGDVPYSGMSDKEIKARYSKGNFPDTKSLGSIGDIIMRCWQGQYNSCDTIIADIEILSAGLLNKQT